jgi:hypothetical protein
MELQRHWNEYVAKATPESREGLSAHATVDALVTYRTYQFDDLSH